MQGGDFYMMQGYGTGRSCQIYHLASSPYCNHNLRIFVILSVPPPPLFFVVVQPRLQIAEQQEQIEALIASGAEHPGSENTFPPALQHLLQRRTESLQVWGWI